MMNRDRHLIRTRFLAGGLLILPLLWSCGGGQEPAPQPKVVAQRIVTAPPAAPARQVVAKPPAAAQTQTVAAPAPAAESETPDRQPGEKAMLGPDSAQFYYVRAGKVDPFSPLFKKEPPPKPVVTKKPDEFVAKTPLQKMDLDQFRLVAILRSHSLGPRAMVEETSGKGYVVKVGTLIGNKGGKVTRIEPSQLVVEEPGQDMYGNDVMVERPLVMQRGEI